MHNIKLSDRLSAISDIIDVGSSVADIGSDHGFLLIDLINKGKSNRVFGVENKIGPFEKMKENIECYSDCSKFELSLSDGISELPKYCDTVVIAGMGGHLIKNIIRNNEDKLKNIKTIIIDPHRDREIIYSYLSAIKYKVIDEIWVKENNIFYCISKWIKTDTIQHYTNLEISYGPISITKKLDTWKKWVNWRIDKINKKLSCENLPKETADKMLEEKLVMEKLIL